MDGRGVKPWGCPRCGDPNGRVRETGQDDDGYKVRLRVCACGTKWATEEVPFDAAGYWTRTSRRHKELARRRIKAAGITKPCHLCGVAYQVNSYRRHVAQSRTHERALAPAYGSRRNRRRIQREWAQRNR
jgi:transcriptional regulator NrdR family protein